MSSVKRFGAFFDGTGNHKDNDRLIGDGSITNIGKLHEMYKGADKFYLEGVGTRSLNENEINLIQSGVTNKSDYYNSSDMAFGVGAKEKVNIMIEKVKNFVEQNPDSEIIIDTFGFSRGSTEARDFINEINAIYKDNPNVKIGSVGLYDTVASIGFSNEYNHDMNLDLNEYSAQKIIHIIAKDETRFNFSLESLKGENGNLPPNFMEIEGHGAHATIGGGNKTVEKEYYKVESGFISSTNDLDKEYQLNKIQQEALSNGLEVHNIREVSDGMLSYDLVNVREVSNGLSNVYLKLMAEELIASGVPLDINNIHLSDDLLGYYNDLKNGNPASLSSDLISKYVHNSDTGERTANDLSDFVANFEEPSGERDVYYNDSKNAIGENNIYEDLNYNPDSQTLSYNDENGNYKQITYSENNDVLFYGNPLNPDKITFTDPDTGEYYEFEKNENGDMVQTNIEDTSLSDGLTNTAINQIGSLIIANNENFSNIEKIAVSSTVSTIANLATYKGEITSEIVTDAGVKSLGSAAVSFAVSSYFAKNDNISDWLGMDGTFVGDFADSMVSTAIGYTAGVFVTNGFSVDAVSNAFTTIPKGAHLTGFESMGASAVGSYIGNALANEIMGWDTKEESMGASIGSTVSSVMTLLATNPATIWLAALYAMGASFIGNIIGGLLGGLFGGTPPPPEAEAFLEFDEETGTYTLIDSSSDNGGNEKAMINIGNNFAKQLVNMFLIPGGQLVDANGMPDILVAQYDDIVKINGHNGDFDTVTEMMADALSEQIPFINVEGGNPYILRAINHTNEKFLEGDPDADIGRANLEELYENIEIAQDYSNYMFETMIILDENGKPIIDQEILGNINKEYLAIQEIEDEEEKKIAIEEFSAKYQFSNQKDYVDNILDEISSEDILIYETNKELLITSFDKQIESAKSKLQNIEKELLDIDSSFEKLQNKYNYAYNEEVKENILSQIKDLEEKEKLLLSEKTQTKEQIEALETEKEESIIAYDNEHFKEIDAIHWNHVFEKAEELRLDEHHYSEDFNKLNSEIAQFNYDEHEKNGELLDIDYEEYLKDVALKMIDDYILVAELEERIEKLRTEEKNSQESETYIDNSEEISKLQEEIKSLSEKKNQALSILDEIGYDIHEGYLNYSNAYTSKFASDEIDIESPSFVEFLKGEHVLDSSLKEDLKVEITTERFNELISLVGIENPLDTFEVADDAFSFLGKNIHDLQFELKDGSLIITTFDKDLTEEKALESSKTFVIEDWENWNKEFTHLELPDGTKINLNELLDLIGVEDGGGKVDVSEAFNAILSEDETISSYLDDFETNHVYIDTSLDDKIKAFFGDNLIITKDGNDNIQTGAGNDIAVLGAGKDSFDGGLGEDTVSYETSNSSVHVNLESGGTFGDAEDDTYSNVENITGTEYDDVLTGSKDDNTIKAGNGNDILSGGEGSDTLDGGEGIDLADYSESKNSVNINLDNNYSIGGDSTGDTLNNIEAIRASDNSDAVIGNQEDNILYGESGDDIINGGTGNDIINGGTGNDYLKGGKGNDELNGNEGNDVLLGGDGNDILVGGLGHNIIDGEDGNDLAIYPGVSSSYEIMFGENKTLYIKSSDGSIKDILKNIEEIAFEDAVFTIDYENQTLIKKVEFENTEEIDDSNNDINNENSGANQAASIATGVMIGTVAAAETIESSSDEADYLSDNTDVDKSSDDINVNENLQQNSIPTLSIEDDIFSDVKLVIDFEKNQTIIDTSVSTLDTTEENSATSDNLDEKNNNVNTSLYTEEVASIEELIQLENADIDTSVDIEEIIEVSKESIEEEELPELQAPTINLDSVEIDEDNILSGIKISNPNLDSSIEVIISGLPEGVLLSAGVLRDNGEWFLQQKDLKDLKIIPVENDSNDFEIQIKATVSDIHGRVIQNILNDKIIIHAVADKATFEVDNFTNALEDELVPLNISTSLVDNIGGKDGEERIVLSVENIPNDAILNAGRKDLDSGIWYLEPEDLEGLMLRPGLHNGDDFIIKVTSYTIESENNNISSISENIKVEISAIADTPILEVSNAVGNEDTQIALDISSNFIDNDTSEILTIKIENIPDNAILNKGIKDENGIWHLTKADLGNLILTPALHDSSDFTLNITAKTKEKENGNETTISKTLDVTVNAIADNVEIDLTQQLTGEEKVQAAEDASIVFFDIKSTFIDQDGSESVHYIIEGVPQGASFNQGEELEEGKWKILSSELEDLGLTLKEHSDEDFRLKVTAVTTEEENGHQKETIKYIDCEIESVADFANLNVSNSEGLQNDFISLDIESSLIDKDGSETLEIIIEQVPEKAILNKGTKDSDGNWHLTTADLDDLSIRPEFNSIENFELKVKAVTTEAKDGSTEESTALINVTVNEIPKDANIIVNAVEVLEDEICELDITIDHTSLNINDSIFLELEIPEETSLNNGEKLSNGNWKLREEDLVNLQINTPLNYSNSFFINIIPTVIKSNGTVIKSEFPTKLPVDIIPVADEVTLEVQDIDIAEDRLIYLNLNSELTDLDKSEKLHLEINGIPDGFLLNVGEKIDNKWIINEKDIPLVAILPTENYSGNFEIDISAVSTESNNDSFTLSKKIKIDISEDIDKPILNISNAFIKNNEAKLNIQSQLRDLDNSESLEIRISNIPIGSSLSNGVLNEDGSYSLRLADLKDLNILNLNNENIEITVEAISGDVKVSKTISLESIENSSPSLIDIHSNEYMELIESIESLENNNSEIFIKVSGIPLDASLNLGEFTSDNSYLVKKEDLSLLRISGADNKSLNLSFSIESITTDTKESIEEVMEINILEDDFSLSDDTTFKSKYNQIIGLLDENNAMFEVVGITDEYTVTPSGVKEGNVYRFTKTEVENLTLDGANTNLNLTLRAIPEPVVEATILEKHFDVNILNTRLKPFMSINNLDISTSTQLSSNEELSDAEDNVQSGGGNDYIYSKSGDDVIYSDKSNGIVSIKLNLNSESSDIKTNEKIIYRIEPLPEGTISNVGYLSNGVLIIEDDIFNGILELDYPYQEDVLSLNVSTNIVNENDVDRYLVSSSISLTVDPLDISGNDYIDAGAMNDYINAGDRDDIILAGSGNDIILGGAGDDFINGGSGEDRIDSGSGNDNIVMDFEDFDNGKFITEILNAGEGFDTVTIDADKGINFDMGLTNVEKFIGSRGNDNIIGSDSSDIVIGGEGVDTYHTGKGDDEAYIDAEDLKLKSSSFINLGEGYDKIYIDDFKGVDFDVSGSNAEEVFAGSGNDILRNIDSNDVKIYGRGGDDTIFASNANDTLDGGEGIDTIDFSNSSSGVNVNLQTGELSGGFAQGDTISNFENIIGTAADDVLVGNDKNNTFSAKGGNNEINGWSGVNTVSFEGNFAEYIKDNNIITTFDSTATVFTSSGINDLSNINILQFDDYKVYIDGTVNSPFVYDDELTTIEDTVLTVNQSTLLENDFSLENSNLRIVEVKNSENGIVSLNPDGTISFTPHLNYNSSTDNTFDKNSALYKGRSGFEYVVEDENGNRSTAFSNVIVSPVNDAPTISSHTFYRTSRITGHGKIVINDVDSDVSSMDISVVSNLTFSYVGPQYISGWDNSDSEGNSPIYSRKTFTRTGYVNINGRTPDDDGVFHYDYRGSYLRDKRMDMYEMRPFVLGISDQGDIGTGENKENILLHTGTYYRRWKRDPLVVDLDGDGIELEEKFFDAHNDIYTAVSSDDAILVWDRDQDGTISSDLETNWVTLSATAENDLDVLREIFDSNKDGTFNEEDKEWQNFALWQDKNSDGLVSDDEFISILDSNILEFNLDENTNKEIIDPIVEFATYTTKDGDVNDIAAAYLDITSTDEKLSEEDLLILQQAIKLNEQLAANENTLIETSSYEEAIVVDVFDEQENIEENIA